MAAMCAGIATFSKPSSAEFSGTGVVGSVCSACCGSVVVGVGVGVGLLGEGVVVNVRVRVRAAAGS